MDAFTQMVWYLISISDLGKCAILIAFMVLFYVMLIMPGRAQRDDELWRLYGPKQDEEGNGS